MADQPNRKLNRSRIRDFLEEAWERIPDIPEEEVEADIREALEAVRQEQRADVTETGKIVEGSLGRMQEVEDFLPPPEELDFKEGSDQPNSEG